MADANDAVVLLQYRTDEASIATAVLANTRVLDSVVAVGVATQSVAEQMAAAGASAEEIFAMTGETISTTTTALNTQAVAVQDLTDLYAALDAQEQQAAADAANVAASGGGGLDGGISLGGARSALRAGGFLLGGAGGQDLRAVGQIATLTSVLGPVGLAAGAAALAFREVSDWEQKASDAGKAYASSLEEVAGVISQGATSADLQKQIDAKKQQQAVEKASQDELLRIGNNFIQLQSTVVYGTDEYNSILKSLNADLYDATGGAVGLKNGLGNISIGEQVLEDALASGQAVIDKTTGSITFLSTEMHTAQVQANNAAAALKVLDDLHQKQNQNYLDSVTANANARAALFQTEQDIAAVEVKTTQDVVAVEAKAADDKVQAAQDAADQVAKIERDAARQLFTDKANRDAVAYVQAQQKEADDLDDQAKALTKKDAAIDKSEQAQLQTITTTEHQKLEVLAAVHAQEVDDVTNTANALVALSYNGALGVVNAHEYMWQAVEATAVRGIHSLINAISTQFGLGVNETPGGSGTPFANAVTGIVDARINQTIYHGLSSGSGASAG